MKKWLLLLVVIPLMAGAGVRVRPVDWAQPVIGIELDNFYQLTESVYRSKQPDDEMMQALEKMGIRSILNLRKYHSDQDEAKGTQLNLFHIPLDAGDFEEEDVVKALNVLATAEKPILIHCWHGSDRTGLIVALYRMIFQDWPRQQAIDEFIHGGFGYHRSFYPNIERYLEAVNLAVIKKQLRLEE